MSRANRKEASTDDRLDALFTALGDRTRRALVARLAKKPAMITELAKPFAMSLPAVSRHIRVLEGAGLVTRTVAGRMHQCSLNPLSLTRVEAWLNQYRELWEGNLESLARYIEGSGTQQKVARKRSVS
jgi:DNA-binding transcriptional ArsR family regulator